MVNVVVMDSFTVEEINNTRKWTTISIERENSMQNRVGKPAVPFDLDDMQGQPHRLEDYRGYWLLLVFHRHLG